MKKENDFKALGYAIFYFIVAVLLSGVIVLGAELWVFLTAKL